MKLIIKNILEKKWAFGRLVLENIIVGTLIGTLVGLILQNYLKNQANQELNWVIFLFIGLLIGVFSGFSRQSLKRYKTVGEKMSVSQSPLSRILKSGRGKVARAVSEGCAIRIEK